MTTVRGKMRRALRVLVRHGVRIPGDFRQEAEGQPAGDGGGPPPASQAGQDLRARTSTVGASSGALSRSSRTIRSARDTNSSCLDWWQKHATSRGMQIRDGRCPSFCPLSSASFAESDPVNTQKLLRDVAWLERSAQGNDVGSQTLDESHRWFDMRSVNFGVPVEGGTERKVVLVRRTTMCTLTAKCSSPRAPPS